MSGGAAGGGGDVVDELENEENKKIPVKLTDRIGIFSSIDEKSFNFYFNKSQIGNDDEKNKNYEIIKKINEYNTQFLNRNFRNKENLKKAIGDKTKYLISDIYTYENLYSGLKDKILTESKEKDKAVRERVEADAARAEAVEALGAQAQTTAEESARADAAEADAARADAARADADAARAEAQAAAAAEAARAEAARAEAARAEASLQTCTDDKTAIYNKFKRILTPPRAPAPDQGGAAAAAAQDEVVGTFKIFDPDEIDINDDNALLGKIRSFSPQRQAQGGTSAQQIAPPQDLNTISNIQNAIEYLKQEIGEIQIPEIYDENRYTQSYTRLAGATQSKNYEGLSKGEQNYKFLGLLDYSSKVIEKNDKVHKIIIGKALIEKLNAKESSLNAQQADQRAEAALGDRNVKLQNDIRKLTEEKEKLKAEQTSLKASISVVEQAGLEAGQRGRDASRRVGQIQDTLDQANERIRELEIELEKKSTLTKVKNFTTSNITEPVKKYFSEEGFSTASKWIMFIIILICISFIIAGIYYMVTIFSNNTTVVKNKDKNDEIIKKLIKS